MMKQVLAAVVYNKEVAKDIFEMKLKSSDAELKYFVPGQFAHLKIPDRSDLLLRRPLSINSVDLSDNSVLLIYQIVGKGSEVLSRVLKDEVIDVIMPIGAGFTLESKFKKIFLVGGGIGNAPLRTIFEKWHDKDYTAFLGFRDKEHAYQLKEYRQACINVYISSNDGSIGKKGFVTDILKEKLKSEKPDVIYTCGPGPMLKALKEVLKDENIPAYVSMEERMGCGIGGCAVCVCGIKKNGKLEYKKTCIEGPVFSLSEVVL